MKTLCKQIIKNRVFLGHYQEKRYVERLKTYKDLVVLNSNEKSFCDDIDLVFKRIQKQINDDNDNGANNDVSVWLGFTAPNVIGAPAAGYCIWSKLNESESNVAFGQYWFQVRISVVHLQVNVMSLKSPQHFCSLAFFFVRFYIGKDHSFQRARN